MEGDALNAARSNGRRGLKFGIDTKILGVCGPGLSSTSPERQRWSGNVRDHWKRQPYWRVRVTWKEFIVAVCILDCVYSIIDTVIRIFNEKGIEILGVGAG